MHNRLLGTYTIVPHSLYVKRAADIQLRRIIDDMGRPGYVLVARQMGKTNLLLNAKREIEEGEDCFLYLDISNNFPNVTSFFRNIIDVAIDTYPEKFEAVKDKIIQNRSAADPTLPHKEHENELKTLLKATQGRLIICLDEIDALTKTNYADQVFSFIRSTYFSGRVNFHDFCRLTYVLSGVAEPTELIKNKAISPFNIGEKIYLDDFTEEEFELFTQKAQLRLSGEILARVYYWANGSPRISWDICAALEEITLSEQEITNATVDRTVRHLYLTNYDLPPIDHIRTQVEDDKDIREALMTIHYGKADAISDEIKNRLYLAGIVRFTQEKSIKLRNRIIEESLSEEWLQGIEQSKLSILERADKAYNGGRFDDAIALYEDYINQATPTSTEEVALLYHKMGLCYRELGRYKDSIEALQKQPFKRNEQPVLYLTQQYWLGLCYFFLNNLTESKEYFARVKDEGAESSVLTHYYDACVNLTSILLHDPEGNGEQVIRLSNDIINDEDKISNLIEDRTRVNKLLYITHYNLAKAYRASRDIEKALFHIKQAVERSDRTARIGLLLEQISIEPNEAAKSKLLVECVEYIVCNRLPVKANSLESPHEFTSDIAARVIEYLGTAEHKELLNHLITHLANRSIAHKENAHSILMSAALTTLTRGNAHAEAQRLINRALEFPREQAPSTERRYLLFLAVVLSPTAEIAPLEAMYREEFWAEDNTCNVIETDYRLFHTFILEHLKRGNVAKARSLVNLALKLVHGNRKDPGSDTSIKEEAGLLVISYLDIRTQVAERQIMDAIDNAHELKNALQKTNAPAPIYFEEAFFEKVLQYLDGLIAMSKSQSPIHRSNKKRGRNELVRVKRPDGSIVTGKFKKLEAQIASGQYILLAEDIQPPAKKR